jgi:hypothetical protein
MSTTKKQDADLRKFDAAMKRGTVGLPTEWGVLGYGIIRTTDGFAYSGDLTLMRGVKAVKVGFFENRGDGGSTLIHWADPSARAVWSALADKLLAGMGEREELLVDCLLNKLGKE